MPSSTLVTIPVKTETILLPGGVPLQLVAVKGGTFTMGDDQSEYDDEKPAHPVQVKDFYISQYPVTNAQYAAFLNDYGSEKVLAGVFMDQVMIYEYNWGCQNKDGHWGPATGFEQHPVTEVTWHGAQEFCNWLVVYTGDKYNLPSESQWEYAARGGQKSEGFPYAGSHRLKEVGWYVSNSHFELKPVGLKKPNELGLYDMSGNVGEWCQDHWHDDYEDVPGTDSPWLDAEKAADPQARRVVRSGSWPDSDNVCWVSKRFNFQAIVWSFTLGFRVVRY